MDKLLNNPIWGAPGSAASRWTKVHYFEVVRTMQIAPINKDAVIRLVAATVAPLVPLLLTMMPLEQLLKTLFGILF